MKTTSKRTAMKVIITTIFLLIALPVLGQIENKGIICDHWAGSDDALDAEGADGVIEVIRRIDMGLRNFEFQEIKIGYAFFPLGVVDTYNLKIENDIVSFNYTFMEDTDSSYSMDAEKIYVGRNKVLDRKTLIMSWTMSDLKTKATSQCKAFDSKEFREAKDQIRGSIQTAYDQKKNGNKI